MDVPQVWARCLGTGPASEYSDADMYARRPNRFPFRSMSGWLVISGLFMALCGLPVSAGAAITTFTAEDYAFTGPV